MHWMVRYYGSTLGKKLLMAGTGIILFLYVVVHMLGNLQIYLGPARLNGYAKLLHASSAFLWTARSVLLFCVLVHIVAAVQLTIRNWGSRPVKYYVRHYKEADYAARTMVWSGPIIAAFVVFHVLDLTTGTLHPGLFIEGNVYHNVVSGFQVWYVALAYIVANALLGFHLYHGLWSLFQTVGANHPTYERFRRIFATVFAVIIAGCNISIPTAVLTRLVS